MSFLLLQVKVPDPMVMAQLKKEHEEVEKLHEQIAELQRENTEKSSHISELNEELSKLRDKISQLEAALKAGTVAAVASNTDTEVNHYLKLISWFWIFAFRFFEIIVFIYIANIFLQFVLGG